MEIMNCEQIKSNLDAFHDGELSADVRSSVEQHLSGCSKCVDELAQIDRVVHAVKTMPRVEVSSKLSADLDRIAEQKVVAFPVKIWAPIAAAAAVALFVGVKFMTPVQPPVTANNIAPQLTPAKPTVVQPEVAVAPKQPTVDEQSVQTQSAKQEEIAAQKPGMVPLPKHDKSEAPVVAEKPSANRVANESTPAQQVVATNTSPSVTISPTATKPGSEEQLAELPSASNALNEAVGIATDEDGLYDLKM